MRSHGFHTGTVPKPRSSCAKYVFAMWKCFFSPLSVRLTNVRFTDCGSQHQHRLLTESFGASRVRGRKRSHQFHPTALRSAVPSSPESVWWGALSSRSGSAAPRKTAYRKIQEPVQWWEMLIWFAVIKIMRNHFSQRCPDFDSWYETVGCSLMLVQFVWSLFEMLT